MIVLVPSPDRVRQFNGFDRRFVLRPDFFRANVKSYSRRNERGAMNVLDLFSRPWFKRLALSGGAVLILAIVNVTMLARTLKKNLNLSSQLTILGIELQYVFALILTLAEVGVGFVFARFSAHSEERGDRLRVLPAFTLFITLLFSLFEGMNYSREGSLAGSSVVPLIGDQVNASRIYFLLGFGIVWSLFLMGHLLAHCATRAIEDEVRN